MDDIRPAVRDDDLRGMTYAEIAVARGISADSAERLAERRGWPKQLANDGTVRVLVPPEPAQPASLRVQRRRQAGRAVGYTIEDSLLVIREVIREAIQALTEQLDVANRRADAERERAERAQQRADDERARAVQAEHRIQELQAALDEKSRALTAVLADLRSSPPGRRRRWWRPRKR
jgi:hypothetical protein